ncbi:hypothetical protein [Alkalicoccus daliensis]|uniref:Uncharacterized protein n=1 Tax=Alkalicoccus daliensis TaxID=745820 RepID=A0A1H0ETQ3_9BACI|nr:hypothetical protein [Alkalicoccus daliensis]SDN85669.1 hypothetical protein SAMN04488053_10463 [Alkalicoccus daliensis]
MDTTEIIEKSMHENHGYTVKEYTNDIDKIIKVEQKRNKSYEQSKQIANEFSPKMG